MVVMVVEKCREGRRGGSPDARVLPQPGGASFALFRPGLGSAR